MFATRFRRRFVVHGGEQNPVNLSFIPHFQELVGEHRLVDADGLFGSFTNTHRVANRPPALLSPNLPNNRSPQRSDFLSLPLHIFYPNHHVPLPSSQFFHSSVQRSTYPMPSICRNISLTVSISHYHRSLYCFLKPTLLRIR